jgi:hypothetical protein
MDENSMDPIEEGGKLVGIMNRTPSGRGDYKIYFDKLFVPGDAQVKNVELTTADNGSFTVLVGFSDNTEGWFVVKRVNDQFRIVALPMIAGKYNY